jgi:cephalosporin hydroxylase
VKNLVQTPTSTTQMRADIATLQAQHGEVLDAFHRLWYQAYFTHGMTYFERVPLLKNPLDLWVYQELIFDLRPTLIIETGTAFGGSALFFARQLEKLGAGSVVTIDIDAAPSVPRHPRITYVPGSSIEPRVVDLVRTRANAHERVMVVLDSDHTAAHVSAELEAYAPLVTKLQFCVVEDTNINGHPVQVDWQGGAGPHAAVETFLQRYPEFERDPLCERYLLTMHPGGWLRRMR